MSPMIRLERVGQCWTDIRGSEGARGVRSSSTDEVLPVRRPTANGLRDLLALRGGRSRWSPFRRRGHGQNALCRLSKVRSPVSAGDRRRTWLQDEPMMTSLRLFGSVPR